MTRLLLDAGRQARPAADSHIPVAGTATVPSRLSYEPVVIVAHFAKCDRAFARRAASRAGASAVHVSGIEVPVAFEVIGLGKSQAEWMGFLSE